METIKTFSSLFVILAITETGSIYTDIPASFMANEVGYGAKGAMMYLQHLVEAVNDVGNLNEWADFMESYLSCEEAAWPYKSDQEKDLKSDLQLINEFCNAWPRRWKCANNLAAKMDVLYKKEHEEKDVGSKALKFSENYVRLICQNKNEYLHTTTGAHLYADKRSLTCFEQNKAKINKCIEQKSLPLERKFEMCKNIRIIQECFSFGLRNSAPQTTIDWTSKFFKQIKIDLSC